MSAGGGVSIMYITKLAASFSEPRSLDERVQHDDGEGESLGDTVVDPRPLPDATVDSAYQRPLIAKGLRGLTRDHAVTVLLRFLGGWSRPEVGEALGVGPAKVSEFERCALRKMQEAVGPHRSRG